MHAKHSTKILAMPLCFIAEGYFKCSLSYLRQELILYCRVNGLRTIKHCLDLVIRHKADISDIQTSI